MKCYNCGYESQDDFAFCSKCGAAQNTAPQGEAVPVQEPAPMQVNTPATPTPAYTPAEPAGHSRTRFLHRDLWRKEF